MIHVKEKDCLRFKLFKNLKLVSAIFYQIFIF